MQVMILTQARGFTHYRHVQMCVVWLWCVCVLHFVTIGIGGLPVEVKINGDSTCTIAVKTINKQYATKINSNILDCEGQCYYKESSSNYLKIKTLNSY